MLITIAALYVVLPACYALACCALALRAPTFDVGADEPQAQANAVYTAVRDECARKAVDALAMATRQPNDSARKVWIDAALIYKRRAEAYHAAIAA